MSGSSLAVVPVPGDDAIPAAAPDPIIHHSDPDLAELEAARAAVAAEAAAPAAPTAEPSAPAPAPAPGAPAMVPHARFQEVNAEMQRWRDAAAYHEGRARALEQGQPAAPAAPAEPPGPSPEVVEAIAIQDGWTKAATDYENGATTATDLAGEQVQLLGRLLRLHVGAAYEGIRHEIASAMRTMQPQVGIVDQQVMAQHQARLEAQHPWSTLLTKADADTLVNMARTEASAMGKSYPPGPAGTMALQQRVAEMASFYMPQWHPGEEPPTAAATPQPPPAVTPPARPPGPTQADVLEAARRQAALPPNTPSAHGANAGPITLDRISTMTDTEIENMPKAERQRLMGISS